MSDQAYNATRQNKYSSINEHQRNKKQLVAPINLLPVAPINWQRDLLPEHLWITSLYKRYGNNFHEMFFNFMDAIDPLLPEDEIAIGLLSDFDLVPEHQRKIFVQNNRDLILNAFHKPFDRILAYYPEAPGHWLILQDEIQKTGPLDPAVELQQLTDLLDILYAEKDSLAGHIRVLPLCRILKHGELVLPPDNQINDLFVRYGKDLSTDETALVQQVARSMLSTYYPIEPRYQSRTWAQYFWRHNFDLAPCVPTPVKNAKDLECAKELVRPLNEPIKENMGILLEYLHEDVLYKIKFDLYDPTRDEILVGLFSRLVRLYVILVSQPDFWMRDIGNIFLRCISETAIVFCYLAIHGTDEEFSNFRAYGEGKDKLLMLHLQDNYPGQTGPDGRAPDNIATAIGGGGFYPELVNIDVANWTEKSIRTMAIDCKMEKYYRLIYDPSSIDLHGTWGSLYSANLVRCGQWMHRFHWLPDCSRLPVLTAFPIRAQEIIEHCIQVAQKHLNYPNLPNPLNPIKSMQ